MQRSSVRKLLLIIGIVCLSIWAIGTAVSGIWSHAQDAYLGSLEQRLGDIKPQFQTAQATVKDQSGHFASHWSTDLITQAGTYSQYLSDSGIPATLARARDVQRDGSGDPTEVAKPAEGQLSQIESFTLTVNGNSSTPGFYQTLQQQTDNFKTLLGTETGNAAATLAYITQLQQDAWNSVHGVKFTQAAETLIRATEAIVAAQNLATAPHDGDNVPYDLPAGYQALQPVEAQINQARQQADAEQSASRAADNEITLADAAILDADHYILASNWQQAQVQQSLQSARSLVDQARAYFAGSPNSNGQLPDYGQAQALARQAQQQASDSQLMAATPTPVPPTPVPPTDTPHSGVVIVPWIIDSGSSGSRDDSDSNYNSPSYSPPSYSPPAYDPPDYDPPDYSPPSNNWTEDDGGYSGSSNSFSEDDGFSDSSNSWTSDDGFDD